MQKFPVRISHGKERGLMAKYSRPSYDNDIKSMCNNDRLHIFLQSLTFLMVF